MNAVYFDGPFPTQDKDGDEIPYWVVFVGGSDREPVGKVYHCSTYQSAGQLALAMARDRRLDLIREASPA